MAAPPQCAGNGGDLGHGKRAHVAKARTGARRGFGVIDGGDFLGSDPAGLIPSQ
jgi:hypothetical protein